MDHGSQPKSRLASITFERELLCLNRAGSMLDITSQMQPPELLIFFFFVIGVYYENVCRMLKPLVPKSPSDLSVRLTLLLALQERSNFEMDLSRS